MRTDVNMPQMGESITQGTITAWLKKVGDKVEVDEPLFEISTDKVDAEIPAPTSGFLAEILTPEGQTVEINVKVAVISSEPVSAGEAAVSGAASELIDSARQDVPPPDARPGLEMDANTLRKVRSSPVVRRISKEHDIDIRAIRGTGLSGRVTKQDILAHLEHIETQRKQTPSVTASSRQQSVASPGPSGSTSQPAAADVLFEAPSHYLPTPGDRDTVGQMSPMRRKIAEHMVWSKRISPHVSTFVEVDMTRIARLRDARKVVFLEKNGIKLTFMPFIMQATLSALRAYPDCNASIREETVIHHQDIHLGMAVSLDWGLIVPVIRNADEKNLLGLSRVLQDIAARARNKKLSPGEVSGGTFSLTNFGAFGSLGGTPIINQPQVAILGVGAVQKRPWVVEGPDGDAIAIRSIMMLSLSYDHRLVDGATGCRFLDHIKQSLEHYDPSQME